MQPLSPTLLHEVFLCLRYDRKDKSRLLVDMDNLLLILQKHGIQCSPWKLEESLKTTLKAFLRAPVSKETLEKVARTIVLEATSLSSGS